MGSSFLDGVDYDATYAITLRVFIRGLAEMRMKLTRTWSPLTRKDNIAYVLVR
jgi:hypothetical protein